VPDDRALVREFLASRDADAFGAMYRGHAAVLFGLAVRLVGRPDAEDVVQDAWVRAIRALPGFRWGSSLRTWLCGIVVNCCRERWAAARSDQGRLGSLDVGDERVVDPAGTAPDPALALDLEAALQRLSPGYRAVVVLHDVYGYTHPEIATLLGCEVGTSKSQLARGRGVLRQLLTACPCDGGPA
jgi:RNA polymerase sigma-70 factor (ECF subfamily)